MVINTISVQYQVFKATTEIPPKKDDSETEGDANDIAKTICTDMRTLLELFITC